MQQMKKEFLYLKQGRMVVIEYEHEFVRLNRYTKNMFYTKNEMCDKFEWGLRDEVRALVAASECMSLAAMTVKAHKMKTIIRDKSRSSERGRMKCECLFFHLHQVLRS